MGFPYPAGGGSCSVPVQVQMTSLGGYCVQMTNGTGSNSIKGTVVRQYASEDDKFAVCETSNQAKWFGVVAESGVANGDPCWVVIFGIAEVLLRDTTAAYAGRFAVASSATDGRIESNSSADADESINLGVCVNSVTAGTDKLCKVLLTPAK